ncbi:cytochrome P450 [Fistulina hepatica ATCC 64428]|uniref:Cytochrome P450 n=1 Tax=Fistulina hepatica ATCC 64428 TaxID=1128425 RepID=A0A0D7AD13_9AGAR|nr:cytochrome P450 [Fistulina hepatica ATCC 64428]
MLIVFLLDQYVSEADLEEFYSVLKFPGAGFKKLAHDLLAGSTDVTNAAYNEVQENIVRGRLVFRGWNNLPIFLYFQIEKQEDENSVKYAAFIIYGAGFETSTYTMRVFFKAMVLHPEVQARTQKEIDEVTGGDHLPNCNDQAHLPYVQALVLEVYRWHCVVSTGFPHRVMEDDIHNGMHIPKESIVMPNAVRISSTAYYIVSGRIEVRETAQKVGSTKIIEQKKALTSGFGVFQARCRARASHGFPFTDLSYLYPYRHVAVISQGHNRGHNRAAHSGPPSQSATDKCLYSQQTRYSSLLRESDGVSANELTV